MYVCMHIRQLEKKKLELFGYYGNMLRNYDLRNVMQKFQEKLQKMMWNSSNHLAIC